MIERDLSAIQNRKARVEASLARSRSVYANLGNADSPARYIQNIAEPGTIEFQRRAIKVASAKGNLREKTIPKLESKLVEATHQFELIEQLVETEINLDSIRQAVGSGLLQSDVLEQTEAYYSSLKKQLGMDDVEISRSEKKTEKNARPDRKTSKKNKKSVPKTITKEKNSEEVKLALLNRQEMTVSHGEASVKLGIREMAVFGHLSEHAGKWVSASRLKKDLRNVGSESEVFRVVYNVRKKLENIGLGTEVVETKRSKTDPRYRLKISVVEKVGGDNFTGRECVANFAENTIKIGSKLSSLTDDEMQVFLTIARAEGMRIRSVDLASELEKKSIEKRQQARIVKSIQKKIEPNPEKPRLLVVTGAKYGSSYELRGLKVDVLEVEDSKVKSETKQKVIPELQERHLVGLGYIIDNPEGDQQIVIDAMGKTKNEIPFTRPQTMMAIKRSSASAFARVKLGVANDDEIQIVSKIEEFVQDSGDDAKTRFKEVINNFFAKDRKSVQDIIDEPVEEPENVVLPTEEEISIVVTLLRNRKDLIKKYNLPAIPKELLDAYSSPTFRRKVERRSEEELMEIRKSACDKVAALIRSDQLYELIDTMSERTSMLAEYFIDLDRKEQLQALEELLIEHQNGVKYTGNKFGVVGDKQEDEIRDAKLARLMSNEPDNSSKADSDVIDLSTKPEDDILSETVPDALIVPVSPISVESNVVENTVKKFDLERRFPDYEERVRKIIERVTETQLEHFNVPQMARMLNLKTKFLEDHSDIKPGAGGDGKPLYGVVAAVQLLAIKEFGNNLPQRMYKELQGYVRSQVQASLS